MKIPLNESLGEPPKEFLRARKRERNFSFFFFFFLVIYHEK